MELSGKRTHSKLNTCSDARSIKRRMLDLGSSPSRQVGNRRTFVPRSSFLLRKKSGDCSSESDDSDYEFDARKRPAVHFKSTPAVDPKLLEAVSKYSDTDDDNSHSINRGFLGQSYSLERRAPISRHSSFSFTSRKQSIPKSDIVARERCFDYLLQSIDEVWARYCDTTSSAETKVYDNLSGMRKSSRESGDHKPRLPSITTVPSHCRNSSFVSMRNFSEEDSDDASGYKSEITNPTEYETDCDYRKVSNLPDSVRLQSLKDRLCKAKNDLEDVYDSSQFEDCARFWRRWDMIKYSAVEMMEEDDDDEIIESIIDELEKGRCYVN